MMFNLFDWLSGANASAILSAVSSADTVSAADVASAADVVSANRMSVFYDSLLISAKGIAGIFIVTVVIILVIAILNKATAKKPKADI